MVDAVGEVVEDVEEEEGEVVITVAAEVEAGEEDWDSHLTTTSILSSMFEIMVCILFLYSSVYSAHRLGVLRISPNYVLISVALPRPLVHC